MLIQSEFLKSYLCWVHCWLVRSSDVLHVPGLLFDLSKANVNSALQASHHTICYLKLLILVEVHQFPELFGLLCLLLWSCPFFIMKFGQFKLRSAFSLRNLLVEEWLPLFGCKKLIVLCNLGSEIQIRVQSAYRGRLNNVYLQQFFVITNARQRS